MGTKIDAAQLAVQAYQAKQLASIGGNLEAIGARIAASAAMDEKLGQARRLLVEMKSSIELCWQRWSQHPAYFHVQIEKIYNLANDQVFTTLFKEFSDINQYKEIVMRVQEVKQASEHHLDESNMKKASEILQYEATIERHGDLYSKVLEHKRKIEVNNLLGTKYAHIVAAGIIAMAVTPTLAIILAIAFSFSIGCYSGLASLCLAAILLFVREPRGTVVVIEQTQSLWKENQNLNPPSIRKLNKLAAEWGGNIDNFLGYYNNLNSEFEALLPPDNLRV